MNLRKKMKKKKTLAERLTPKRKSFIDKYIENGGNASQAVKDVYNPGGKGGKDSDASARSMGSELLKMDDVRAYFAKMASGAAERVEDLSISARSEIVRLQANKDILDRAGLKASDRVDITTKGDKLYTNEQITRAAAEIISGADSDDGSTSQE